jgi:hypothetical protein
MNEKITVPITFEKIFNGHDGKLHMHISDCYGEVKDENENTIGHVGASIGACIDISIGTDLWTCRPMDFWQAFQTALQVAQSPKPPDNRNNNSEITKSLCMGCKNNGACDAQEIIQSVITECKNYMQS